MRGGQPYSSRPLGVPAHKLWFRDLKIVESDEPVTHLRPQNGYKPRGRLTKIWRTRAPQVIVSGPAETGKTLAVLQYIDSLAWEYPGLQGLIMRKTYNSTVSSVLQTYERLVLGPMTPVEKRGGGTPQWYDYPNGSRIWVGGMDNASRVLSSERDVIFVNQAEELSLDDWETLSTRTSGRAGNMPFGQLVGDCNPSNSSHWIKKLGDQKKVEFIESRHTDNPMLYDEDGNLTERGRMTMKNLDLLTGVRRKRLKDGIWAAAEGMVYEDAYDPDIHLVDRFDIPSEWTRYWVVDFGFTNPFVCQYWAEDGDGRLYRYREIYHTGRLVEDHARQMLKVSEDEPKPVAIVCDHDAEGRATLEKHLRMKTVAARKQVKEGIQAVTARMKKQGDGKARIFLLKDSLVEPDPDLDERKLPMMTEEEVEGYLWNQKAGHNEEPIKQNDHGMDALRYLVMHLEKPKKKLKLFC